jgi:hypothetical protein
MEDVTNVTTLVLNVLVLLTIVTHVKVTELVLQLVNVQPDISKPLLKTVQSVTINVLLVLNSTTNVLYVPKTELVNQLVIAQMVLITLKTKLYVQLVTKNVKDVSLAQITVSLVPVT